MSYILNKIKGSTEDAIALEKDCKQLQKDIDDKLAVIKEIRRFIYIHKGTCSIKELKNLELEKYVALIFQADNPTSIPSPILTAPSKRPVKKDLTALNAGKNEFFLEYRRRQATADADGLTLTWREYLKDRRNEKLK
mgnify:CR=1 FL=1